METLPASAASSTLAGVFGHLKVQHTTPSIGQHHEHKQNPEGRCRHHKEVDGGHLLHVIGQASSPSLGRWLPRAPVGAPEAQTPRCILLENRELMTKR